MGAEEEDGNVRVTQKNNSFLVKFFSVSYLLIFDRSLTVLVTENRDDDDDDDDDDAGEELFSWHDISVNHFDLVHRMTRILMLIPDKLCTACRISAENIPDETGEFLLNLVSKLYDECIEEGINKNYPNSFVSIISDLREQFRDLTIGFVNRDIDQNEIEEFLNRCQPIFNVAVLIADWGHFELLHLQRHRIFSANAFDKLFDLCSKLYDRNLLSDYRELSGRNELFNEV